MAGLPKLARLFSGQRLGDQRLRRARVSFLPLPCHLVVREPLAQLVQEPPPPPEVAGEKGPLDQLPGRPPVRRPKNRVLRTYRVELAQQVETLERVALAQRQLGLLEQEPAHPVRQAQPARVSPANVGEILKGFVELPALQEQVGLPEQHVFEIDDLLDVPPSYLVLLCSFVEQPQLNFVVRPKVGQRPRPQRLAIIL